VLHLHQTVSGILHPILELLPDQVYCSLKNVQCGATQLVAGFRMKSYEERLRLIGLTTWRKEEQGVIG
jgi:hypothetical protein